MAEVAGYRPALTIALALSPYRRLFDFSGRSTRSEVFLFWFAGQLIGAVAISFAQWLGGALVSQPGWTLNAFLGDAFPIALVYLPMFALLVRRMHDIGLPGWPAAPLLIAVLGFWSWDRWAFSHHDWAMPWWIKPAHALCVIATLAAMFWRPTEGANRFGPDPRL